MSKPIESAEVPESIGRNDPCPCGSERKYKKCCQRAHRLQKETEKKSREPHKLITEDTLPWKVYKVLTQVYENNAFSLFHELFHDESPLRKRYETKADFIGEVDTGAAILPAGPDFDFLHMRLDPPNTYLLLREDDPKKGEVGFQVIALRPNELDATGAERDVEHKGYRLWDVTTHRIDRQELSGDEVPALEIFDVSWKPKTS